MCDPPLKEPLEPGAAKRLIRKIMAKDDLTTVDCVNVLRGGVVQPGELERGSWRYRVGTARMCVVVAFRSEDELAVVTAWRTE